MELRVKVGQEMAVKVIDMKHREAGGWQPCHLRRDKHQQQNEK